MRRIQFIVKGNHPLLLVVRDHLIKSGYALVPEDDVDYTLPIFCLMGGPLYCGSTTYPVLLLSSSDVYSDRDHLLNQLPVESMDEAHGHVVTSPLDPNVFSTLDSLRAEAELCQRSEGKTMVIRPFNVYGPGITEGVVAKFIDQALHGAKITVHTPGRLIRTFLYVDDFLVGIDLILAKLLKGSRGIYNIGSTEQVEILSLAQSVRHAYKSDVPIELVEPEIRHCWWKVPSVERMKLDTNWRAKTSLRSGLFLMAGL